MTTKLGNNLYIPRTIETPIKKYLFRGRAIIIYGARQTGKTTLVKKILAGFPKRPSVYFNGDEGTVQRKFSQADNSSSLKNIIGKAEIVVIDEAQKIRNIGLKLKLLVDTYPQQQIIATGSSSFELTEEIMEPMTGRTWNFSLYPLSITELASSWSKIDPDRHLESALIYGSYPTVVDAATEEDKIASLRHLTENYLYKDLLKFQNLKASETIQKLLQALALQIGQEVSYNELAALLEINKVTVARYVDVLEKVFVIFKLRPLSRNLRSELNRLHKIYFFDNGIRNALINNLNPLALRTDKGALWENFIVSEFKKQQYWAANSAPLYFWRTYDQAEIDLVKDEGGKLFAYEIKWQKAKTHPPKNFIETYKNSTFQTVTSENFLDFFKI